MNGFSKVNLGFTSSYGKAAGRPDWIQMFKAIDSDNNGKIDYDEFMTAAMNRSKLLNKQNLLVAFTALDKNGDGILTSDELEIAFSRGNLKNLTHHGVEINETFWQQLMADIDTNKDGHVDFDEFEAYMMKLISEESAVQL